MTERKDFPFSGIKIIEKAENRKRVGKIKTQINNE